jgi:hypothetical protein
VCRARENRGVERPVPGMTSLPFPNELFRFVIITKIN